MIDGIIEYDCLCATTSHRKIHLQFTCEKSNESHSKIGILRITLRVSDGKAADHRGRIIATSRVRWDITVVMSGKGPRRSARGKGGGATGRRGRDDADFFNDDEFKSSKSATRSTGSKNSGGKSSSVDQGRNKESKGGRNNKENISPARRTTRSRSKATTKAKPAAGIAKAGDVILISRDDGTKVTKERAEVLEIDPRTGMAKLCYEKTAMEATEVKLSELTYTVEDKYIEPVPQHQKDLPVFADIAPGAPRYKSDNMSALRSLMTAHTLEEYDADIL